MSETSSKRPNRVGIWLLSRMLSRRKNYGFFGDIEELYAYQIEEKGRFQAGLWFWVQILRTIPHYLLDSCYWSWIMFQNYFKVTFRSLKRHKAYSFINFAGLAVGMACCILILTYVHWELSYDRYHEKSDRIFRLAVNGDINDRAFNIACVNNPPGPYLAQEWPEVEAAARRFGWDEPLGKRIRELDDRIVLKTVVGVIKDYHFTSLHNTIEPLLITNIRENYGALIIKLGPGDLPAVLGNLQARWESVVPGLPFDHFFLDQEFASQYRAEERLSRIFAYFSLLAIFIACLGLFGMAADAAEQRTKEIGIRKVLGASAGQLVLLLNREFSALVILANLAAWPLVYWFARRWLEDFAYRTSLNLSIFFLCALAVFAIGILTVSYQSIRAAHADPVDSLKYE